MVVRHYSSMDVIDGIDVGIILLTNSIRQYHDDPGDLKSCIYQLLFGNTERLDRFTCMSH